MTDLLTPGTTPVTKHPDTALDPDTVDAAIAGLEETEFNADTVLPMPTREQCIEAIIREANCNRQRAEELHDFHEAVAKAYRESCTVHPGGVLDGCFQRVKGEWIYHLGTVDLELHCFFEVIAPDNQLPEFGSGSAHDLLTRAHLRPDLDEVALVHGRDGEIIENCTVTLARI